MPFRKLPTVLLGCVIAVALSSPAEAFRSFQLGIHEPSAGAGDAGVFDRMDAAGAQIARVTATWTSIAPNTSQKPAGFDPRNPADPNYNWTGLDGFVRAASSRGMAPLVTTYYAPPWAEGDDASDRARRTGKTGTYHPNAKEYGDFIFALATRYSGSFPDPANPGQNLPRVRYFQLWNEVNFGAYLNSRRKSEIPIYYAKLLNAGYDSAKAVSRSNQVLTAGMGPFGNNGEAVDVEPQLFMRSLFCLTGKGGKRLKEKRRCKVPRPKFDIWTQHPYTFGGTPRSQAGSADGAAIGDMPEIKRTLDFAVRKRNVLPRGRKKLWSTEFAWFSNPPGIKAGDGRELGAPLSRHAAYLSETAYRLWRLRFEALVWYGLIDHNQFPSGLSFADGRPKPALEAFKLPFYADHSRRGTLVWGIAPERAKTRVRIEKRSGSRWKRVVDLSTDSRGMFYDRIRGNRGTYRARSLGSGSSGSGSGSGQSQGDAYTDPSRPFKAR
jgi:hypothetical protein